MLYAISIWIKIMIIMRTYIQHQVDLALHQKYNDFSYAWKMVWYCNPVEGKLQCTLWTILLRLWRAERSLRIRRVSQSDLRPFSVSVVRLNWCHSSFSVQSLASSSTLIYPMSFSFASWGGKWRERELQLFIIRTCGKHLRILHGMISNIARCLRSE